MKSPLIIYTFANLRRKFVSKENRILTLSNLFSVIRAFLLIPILISLSHEDRIWAVIWMVLAFITDFLDGYLARRWDQRSNFGRIIDPLADKIVVLGISFFMAISTKYNFPMWFLVFILTREFIMMICSLIVIHKKNVVMESNRPGKNSAIAVGLTVFLFAMKLQPYGWIILWCALGLTLYSSWIYFSLFLKQIRKPT